MEEISLFLFVQYLANVVRITDSVRRVLSDDTLRL
jgi:hypothetical protein